jgi:thiosulfate/3-mercaptopyruvate sulfurtransferase
VHDARSTSSSAVTIVERDRLSQVLDGSLLIETAALERRLGDPALRVFDCTVGIEFGADRVSFRSGRDDWAEAHVPAADFLDLLEELAAPDPELHFMLPSAEQLGEAMSAHGVEDGTQVVLYDASNGSWAARVWWMLHAYGFDDAVVLDGGWTKWVREGRPVSSDPPRRRRGRFLPRPREGVFVGKEAVLAGMRDGATCLVNALPVALHQGRGPAIPGRRQGHIPTSENVPADSLVDPETKAFLPEGELRALLEGAGALHAGRVVTYCGGGIAASGVAFALRLLGHDDVAVYDASLEEWARDPSLPLEMG